MKASTFITCAPVTCFAKRRSDIILAFAVFACLNHVVSSKFVCRDDETWRVEWYHKNHVVPRIRECEWLVETDPGDEDRCTMIGTNGVSGYVACPITCNSCEIAGAASRSSKSPTPRPTVSPTPLPTPPPSRKPKQTASAGSPPATPPTEFVCQDDETWRVEWHHKNFVKPFIMKCEWVGESEPGEDRCSLTGLNGLSGYASCPITCKSCEIAASSSRTKKTPTPRPTVSPTPLPTPIPTRMPKQSTNEPTTTTTPIEFVCQDDDSWIHTTRRGAPKQCNYVARDTNDRCDNLGKNSQGEELSGYLACPLTCDSCSMAEDAFYERTTKGQAIVKTVSPTRAPTTDPTVAPSSSPTPLPSASPTPLPTLSPTRAPTLSPTPSPTAEPTKAPTLPPTKAPTQSPTTTPTDAPTSSPTPQPTRSPTNSPTNSPTQEPTEAPTPPPTITSTPKPTLAPTNAPTQVPTLAPTPEPTPTILPSAPDKTTTGAVETLGTGNVCSEDSVCRSKTCRNGACMASEDCYPIKHKYGTPFDSNTINIVFVGSKFNTGTHEEWRTQVDKAYAMFDNYAMFSKSIDKLNVFVVDPPKLSDSFCKYDCSGIDRLLCCDVDMAQRLSDKCFPSGANLQTVVIHNDMRYGGAGYVSNNMATMSTHPQGPLIAIHELGHSLFELTDEYSYGPGTSESPNCSADKKCSKWSDLVGGKNKLAGYKNVKCQKGCKNNNYYVSGKTFMDKLSEPVGAVNERFTCCTYQALTKTMPSYCDVFDKSENYLFNYCKNNDYQKYGATSYDDKPKEFILSEARANDDKYVFVSEPMLIKVKLNDGGKGNALLVGKPVSLSPGLFRKSQVLGDYTRKKQAARNGEDSVMVLRVFYQAGKEILLYTLNAKIEIPLPPGNSTDPDAPQSVSEMSNLLEIILDKKGRTIEKVRPRIESTR